MNSFFGQEKSIKPPSIPSNYETVKEVDYFQPLYTIRTWEFLIRKDFMQISKKHFKLQKYYFLEIFK
jgi:hypothetical protein